MNAYGIYGLSYGVILWICAAFAFVLWLSSGVVAEMMVGNRRDAMARLLRSLVMIGVLMLAVIPGILVTLYVQAIEPGAHFEPENLVGLIAYVFFLCCFCYSLGKRIGFARGKQHMSDLIGVESRETLEEIQDRLFESKMRYPRRHDVVKSIGELSKREDAVRDVGESSPRKAGVDLGDALRRAMQDIDKPGDQSV